MTPQMMLVGLKE